MGEFDRQYSLSGRIALESAMSSSMADTSYRQNFSHYLPVWLKSHPKSARKSSVENDDKKKQTDKERSGRASALPESKRRATMNSRAAFDEDEVLRKVIEESKAEQQASTEGGSRKGKRNRDDSEE
jgi:hypothetical protein